MTLRDWTDPRDGRHWRVRQTGLPTVLVFASEDDLFSVVIDFNDKLEDRSDAELERQQNREPLGDSNALVWERVP